MGIIARNVVGRRVLALGDQLLLKVPIYRRLYPSVKMLIDSFSPERRSAFRAVVLVQHPRQGEYAFGFVTSELTIDTPDGKREMVTVFVPDEQPLPRRHHGGAARGRPRDRPLGRRGAADHPVRGNRHSVAPAAVLI